MKKSHIPALLLLLAGIAVMAVHVILEVRNITTSNRRIDEFMQAADINEDNEELYEKEVKERKVKTKKKRKVDKKNEDSEKMESIVIDDAYAIAVISIPAIKLQYLVYEGTSDYLLSKGIGHYKTSEMFGEKGNCVLAGHTGSYDGVFFDRLPDLQSGDQIIITDINKKSYIYSVESCFITTPDDVRIINTDPDERSLTLLTCADGGQNRYVCHCRLVTD